MGGDADDAGASSAFDFAFDGDDDCVEFTGVADSFIVRFFEFSVADCTVLKTFCLGWTEERQDGGIVGWPEEHDAVEVLKQRSIEVWADDVSPNEPVRGPPKPLDASVTEREISTLKTGVES